MPKRITIEQLALMVAHGFQELNEKIASITTNMATKEDLAAVAHDMTTNMQRLENRIEHLEVGQGKIHLQLNSVVQKHETKTLRKRVLRIEQHLGLT